MHGVICLPGPPKAILQLLFDLPGRLLGNINSMTSSSGAAIARMRLIRPQKWQVTESACDQGVCARTVSEHDLAS